MNKLYSEFGKVSGGEVGYDKTFSIRREGIGDSIFGKLKNIWISISNIFKAYYNKYSQNIFELENMVKSI